MEERERPAVRLSLNVVVVSFRVVPLRLRSSLQLRTEGERERTFAQRISHPINELYCPMTD